VRENREKPEISMVWGDTTQAITRTLTLKNQLAKEAKCVKKDPENCFSRSNFFALNFYSVPRLGVTQIGPSRSLKENDRECEFEDKWKCEETTKSFPLDRY
jgi:hypothetical protein